MTAPRLLALLLAGTLGLAQVSAVEVYTAEELTVSNGTEARLQCTFTSSEVISRIASVIWSFQGQGSPSPMPFFYYFSERAYPGVGMPFKDRVSWAGDLNKRDASINIANIQFQDSGTYLCDVKNPPDNIVTPGTIKLQVVERDSAVRDYRTGNILCLAVAGVILLLLVFIVVTDHLFWKEQRHKMLKPLANTGNEQRFPSDGSRTTQLLYQNVRL